MSGLVYFGSGASGGTGDEVKFLHPDQGGNVAPDALGILNINGGANINPTIGTPTTITISLNDSVYLPTTVGPDGAGSSGIYGIENTRVLHTMGGLANGNIFLGSNAGNLVAGPGGLTGQNNTIVGTNSGASLTSGFSNCTLGSNNLLNNTTGASNVALGAGCLVNNVSGAGNISIGAGSLFNNVSGDRNLSIGTNAGAANDATAHDNINIGNSGGAGINNRTTIGAVAGGGAGQSEFYAHGIYQAPVGAVNENVVIDSTGKLGSVSTVNTDYSFTGGLDANIPLLPNRVIVMGATIPINVRHDPSGCWINSYIYHPKTAGMYLCIFNLSFTNIKKTNGAKCKMDIISSQGPTIIKGHWWSPYYASYTKGVQGSTQVSASQTFSIAFYQNAPYNPTLGIFFQFGCRGEGIETSDLTLTTDSYISIGLIS